MYDLGSSFANTAVPPGKNLLIAGPPLSGVRRIAFSALAADGEHAIVITARHRAKQVRKELEGTVGGTVGIVDCVTAHQSRTPAGDERTRYAASPADFSGIGMGFSALEKEFSADGATRIRVVVDSLSLLVPYAGLQAVCEFMTVLTDRIAEIDGLGLHVIESPAHTPEELETLSALFDAKIDVEADEVVMETLPTFDDSG